MAVEEVTIVLSAKTAALANEQAARLGFSDVGRYLETLIEAEAIQDYGAPEHLSPRTREEFEALIKEGLESPAITMTPDDWADAPRIDRKASLGWIMPQLIVRQRAKNDVLDHAARIALDKLEPALRFISAAEKAFTYLSEHPYAGPRLDPPVPSSPELRFWPITRFRNYLVIYQPTDDGAEIIRVMHGAQDLPTAIFQP